MIFSILFEIVIDIWIVYSSINVQLDLIISNGPRVDRLQQKLLIYMTKLHNGYSNFLSSRYFEKNSIRSCIIHIHFTCTEPKKRLSLNNFTVLHLIIALFYKIFYEAFLVSQPRDLLSFFHKSIWRMNFVVENLFLYEIFECYYYAKVLAQINFNISNKRRSPIHLGDGAYFILEVTQLHRVWYYI